MCLTRLWLRRAFLVAAVMGNANTQRKSTPSPREQRASNNRGSPLDQVHSIVVCAWTAFLQCFPVARSRHVTHSAVTHCMSAARDGDFAYNVAFLQRKPFLHLQCAVCQWRNAPSAVHGSNQNCRVRSKRKPSEKLNFWSIRCARHCISGSSRHRPARCQVDV